ACAGEAKRGKPKDKKDSAAGERRQSRSVCTDVGFGPHLGADLRCGPGTYFGCATTRKYGFSVLNPCGYFFFASSSDTDVGMITSSPGFQFTGVATACFALSCSESSRRNTSS